jgi:hypothetical protein
MLFIRINKVEVEQAIKDANWGRLFELGNHEKLLRRFINDLITDTFCQFVWLHEIYDIHTIDVLQFLHKMRFMSKGRKKIICSFFLLVKSIKYSKHDLKMLFC